MGFKNFRIRGGDRKVKKYIEDLREQIVRAINPWQVILFGKTHDLIQLLNLALAVEPSWSTLQSDLSVLTNYAVDLRYPGLFANKIEAQEAVRKCRQVRRVIRLAFGLPA
jgi:hypothetical protein